MHWSRSRWPFALLQSFSYMFCNPLRELFGDVLEFRPGGARYDQSVSPFVFLGSTERKPP
jgi:hypothetical protein